MGRGPEDLREDEARRRIGEIASQIITLERQAPKDAPSSLEWAANEVTKSGVKVSYRHTPPMTEGQVRADQTLGNSHVGSGMQAQNLQMLAFSVRDLHPNDDRPVFVELKRVFSQPMDVASGQEVRQAGVARGRGPTRPHAGEPD